MNMQQAKIIIEQLGGSLFKEFTGAKNFAYSDNGLTFKIGQNAKRINGVRIQLDPMDYYTVEFLRVSVKGAKIVSSHEMIYCDQLQELFIEVTGMYVP